MAFRRNETTGTHYNISCPHCGGNNHYVCDGVGVKCGTVTRFQKSCKHCKKIIFYNATHEIVVIAYDEDPVAP